MHRQVSVVKEFKGTDESNVIPVPCNDSKSSENLIPDLGFSAGVVSKDLDPDFGNGAPIPHEDLIPHEDSTSDSFKNSTEHKDLELESSKQSDEHDLNRDLDIFQDSKLSNDSEIDVVNILPEDKKEQDENGGSQIEQCIPGDLVVSDSSNHTDIAVIGDMDSKSISMPISSVTLAEIDAYQQKPIGSNEPGVFDYLEPGKTDDIDLLIKENASGYSVDLNKSEQIESDSAKGKEHQLVSSEDEISANSAQRDECNRYDEDSELEEFNKMELFCQEMSTGTKKPVDDDSAVSESMLHSKQFNSITTPNEINSSTSVDDDNSESTFGNQGVNSEIVENFGLSESVSRNTESSYDSKSKIAAEFCDVSNQNVNAIIEQELIEGELKTVNAQLLAESLDIVESVERQNSNIDTNSVEKVKLESVDTATMQNCDLVPDFVEGMEPKVIESLKGQNDEQVACEFTGIEQQITEPIEIPNDKFVIKSFDKQEQETVESGEVENAVLVPEITNGIKLESIESVTEQHTELVPVSAATGTLESPDIQNVELATESAGQETSELPKVSLATESTEEMKPLPSQSGDMKEVEFVPKSVEQDTMKPAVVELNSVPVPVSANEMKLRTAESIADQKDELLPESTKDMKKETIDNIDLQNVDLVPESAKRDEQETVEFNEVPNVELMPEITDRKEKDIKESLKIPIAVPVSELKQEIAELTDLQNVVHVSESAEAMEVEIDDSVKVQNLELMIESAKKNEQETIEPMKTGSIELLTTAPQGEHETMESMLMPIAVPEILSETVNEMKGESFEPIQESADGVEQKMFDIPENSKLAYGDGNGEKGEIHDPVLMENLSESAENGKDINSDELSVTLFKPTATTPTDFTSAPKIDSVELNVNCNPVACEQEISILESIPCEINNIDLEHAEDVNSIEPYIESVPASSVEESHSKPTHSSNLMQDLPCDTRSDAANMSESLNPANIAPKTEVNAEVNKVELKNKEHTARPDLIPEIDNIIFSSKVEDPGRYPSDSFYGSDFGNSVISPDSGIDEIQEAEVCMSESGMTSSDSTFGMSSVEALPLPGSTVTDGGQVLYCAKDTVDWNSSGYIGHFVSASLSEGMDEVNMNKDQRKDTCTQSVNSTDLATVNTVLAQKNDKEMDNNKTMKTSVSSEDKTDDVGNMNSISIAGEKSQEITSDVSTKSTNKAVEIEVNGCMSTDKPVFIDEVFSAFSEKLEAESPSTPCSVETLPLQVSGLKSY